MQRRTYFFLTFWVRADAAADFAALLALGLLRTFEAVDATLALVFSVLPFWVRAEAATDFSALLALGLLKTFEAAVATFLLVLSDFAIGPVSLLKGRSWRGRRSGTLPDSRSGVSGRPASDQNKNREWGKPGSPNRMMQPSHGNRPALWHFVPRAPPQAQP